MAVSMKNVDLAFQGVGQKAGMDIWRIEDFRPVPLPKSDFGKFYSGDSYIVLQTTALKSGGFHYDIHFWLGKDTSQDEAGTAAIKTVELDAALGGRAVQHREIQGHETDKFLSYFKPCIIPLDGGVASGFKKVEAEKYEPRLYVCKGRRVVRVKEVPYTRTSLNHDDVFILDTESKIYQFNGSTSNIQERAKALQVVQYIKDTYHEGKCDIAIVEDGKLVADSDIGEFWSLFGGFAPIGKKLGSDDDIQADSTSTKLYCIVDGKPDVVEASQLSKGLLESNRCYMLDCGSEVYLWVGRITTLEDRKAASLTVEEFLANHKRQKIVHITRVIQGFEPLSFRTKFDVWPLTSGTSVSEDGRGKVAAMLKQQGVNVKGILKAAPGKEEEVPPLFDTNGKLEVWRVNGQSKTPVITADCCKFYTGDCYIVLYTYPGDRKDDYFLCSWLGRHSTLEEQAAASRLVGQMANSFKGRPVQGRILQGKEPAYFLALFQNMFIFKGGLSAGYKKQISDKGIIDDTYKEDTVALIEVRGTAPYNTQAVQVDLDATSLNSCDCFILQTGSTIFLWNGSASAVETQQIAAKMADILKPSASAKILKEGSEPATFWNPLGGKKSYTSKREFRENGKDPRLFACNLTKGTLEVTEIFNFTQDDLLSEDVMILDTYSEVFVWVGQHTDSQEREAAFEIAQKYIDYANSAEGFPQDIPIYKVTEGNEPFFFTRYFETWDPIKAAVQGSSFEKRLSTLLGWPAQASEAPKRRTAVERSDIDSVGKPFDGHNRVATSEHRGPTQRAAALAALSSAFSAANITDANKTAYRKPVKAIKSPSSTTAVNSDSQTSTDIAALDPAPLDTETSNSVESKADSSSPESNGPDNGNTEIGDADQEKAYINYECLKAKSADPALGIDPRKRESYLSPEDFRKIFGMDLKQFYELPRWKQDMHKKAVDLF